MLIQTEDKLIIQLSETAPEEHRRALVKALSSALRWYALFEEKRITDHQDAAVIADLISELNEELKVAS